MSAKEKKKPADIVHSPAKKKAHQGHATRPFRGAKKQSKKNTLTVRTQLNALY